MLSPLRRDSASTNDEDGQQKFYSKIQQLLMDSVLRLKNSGSNKHAISAQHFAATVRVLTNIPHLQMPSAFRDLALERLAQAVSAAMSANCIYGNKRNEKNPTLKSIILRI